MSLPETGEVSYIDDYGTSYHTSWRTVTSQDSQLLDITTTTITPYVWGRPIEGTVSGRQVLRQGMVDISRHVLSLEDTRYNIVAEGGLLQLGEVPLRFRLESQASPFAYHLNNAIVGDHENTVVTGPHFVDPADENDDCVWAEIDDLGTQGTFDSFDFIDVWGSDE